MGGTGHSGLGEAELVGQGIGITVMLKEGQIWLLRLPTACPSPPGSPGAASPLPAALPQWFLGSCFQTVHQLIFR